MYSNNTFWALLLMAGIVGLATGFAVPLVASYQTKNVFEPRNIVMPFPYDVARDAEVEKLIARNRRLEATVAKLREKKAEEVAKRVLDELDEHP